MNFDVGQIDLSGSADIDSFLTTKGGDGGSHTTSSLLQKIDIPTSEGFEVGSLETQPAPGIDALFNPQPQVVTAHRRRVASMQDLLGYTRISAETLINRSKNDLWALKKEADGNFYIERLFDDNGSPLKG